MSNTTYLLPGFLVAITGNRSIKLPLLRKQAPRATRPRQALLDALNNGYDGSLDDLVVQLAQRFDVTPNGIRAFLRLLKENGYLTDTAPTASFSGEPCGALGTVDSGEVTIPAPVTLLTQAGKYLWYDHQGNLLLRLSLPELQATLVFATPITTRSAWEFYCEQAYIDSLSETQFEELLSRLSGAGLLNPRSPADDFEEAPLIGAVDRVALQALVDLRVAAHDENIANAHKTLVPVVPVNPLPGMVPVSLGMVVAYAMEYDGKRLCDKYDFIPMFLTDEARLLERAETTGIFLFSNYIWCVEENLKLSAAVKAVNPANITIHGGPSTPKYEADAETFFADNPHVDIIVRGEGELTFADMLDALDLANSPDLEALRDVPGLTYRTATGVARTADREQIPDVNTLPSPFLMGLYEEFGSVRAAAVIETNRGCPYGCTFCDWGSATLSRIRKFDLDRVFQELEWCAQKKIKEASIADANFGMLERDVTITEKVAELRRTYGYPGTVNINYAKNQVKYLRKIIEIMADVNILAEGVVSLQSMDEQTLKVIDRSNIKLDKYNELSTEFRRARLPLAADIMMGLPGSTPAAFLSDLQKCTDRDIRVRAHHTQLLPNSPMNDPGYREEHGIVARPGEMLMETATYTRGQWEEMEGLRTAFCLFDSYGLLRYVARYVRREMGMGEVEFYEKLRSEVSQHPSDWPIINTTLKSMQAHMAPPGSWALFVEEVHRYLVRCLQIPDDSGLRTTLAVQLVHLPATGRIFPYTLELEHDYAAWQEVLFNTREEGHREDWQNHIPRLCEFGPATLIVHDPNEICRRDVGKSKYLLDMNLRTWELDSPVARPRLASK